MATLKDIAAEAGVSTMTVSNVINGNYGKVSAKNVEKINKLIEKYNYVPNLSARSLTSKSSKIIVVFLPSINPLANCFTNPYLGELFGEIETLIRKAGYFVLIQSLENVSSIPTILKNWSADGAIFLTHQDETSINKILEINECPIIFIDSYNLGNPSALMVGINDYKGGYIATKHLICNGHRKIAFAGPYNESNDIIFHRFQGYQAALAEAEVEYREDFLIKTNTTYEDGIEVGRAIANKSNGITSVFATADILAIGIIEGAHMNGYTVPNDLSVIGFDNLQICSFITPKLTTISQNVKQKAEAAVDLLMKAINNTTMIDRTVTLDVELAERQSVRKIII